MKKFLWIFLAACAITITSCSGVKSTNAVESTDSIETVVPADTLSTDSVIVEDGDTIGVV